MTARLDRFNWDDIKVFLVVSRAGTIRRAAQMLKTNHATVSRRLTALEAALDSRLFDRSKEGLVATQLGEELLPHALKVERDIAAATRCVIGRDTRPAGVIHVSIPGFFARTVVMEDIAKFAATYETVQLAIDFSNSIANLERREADVSIRFAHEVTDDVVGRKLVHLTKAAYCSPEYAAKMQDNQGEGLNWIGWNEREDRDSAAWISTTPYPKATLRHRCFNSAGQIALAAVGEGLAMLPCCMGDTLSELVRAPYQKPQSDRWIWLLVHRDLQHTARIRLFLDFMAERILARRAQFDAA